MKHLFTLIIFLAFTSTGIGQKITIDSSFGENGIRYFEDTINLYEAVFEKDYKNRILIGFQNVNNYFVDSTYSIYRYLETGEKDETFGLNGKGLILPKYYADFIQFQILPDNKIIMLEIEYLADFGCQYIYKGPIKLKRLLENGDIDTTYGDSGIVKIELDSNVISTANITVQNDSHTLLYVDYISCNPLSPPIFNSYIYRINPSGQIDSVFGDNGVLKLKSIGFLNYCEVLIKMSQDNKIILGSCVYDIDNIRIKMLTRLNQNGDVDTSFGDNGIVLVESPYFKMSPDYSIFIYNHTYPTFCITKISQNGNIDTSFADQGKLCFPSTTVFFPHITDFDFYDKNLVIIGSYSEDGNHLTIRKTFIWFADKGKDLYESLLNGEVFLLNVDDNIYYRKIWSINNDRVTIYGEKYINNRLILFFTRFKIDKASNLENEIKIEDVNIFPNPTSSTFHLDLPKDFNYDNAIMTVYDLYGRLVLIKKGWETGKTHDVSGLGNGIYFIELRQNDKTFRNKLLITR